MDAELKAKWIDALRSGEYKQARATLRDNSGAYCCLGVLCKVAGIELNTEGRFPASENSYKPIFELIGSEDASKQCSSRNDGSVYGGVGRRWTFSEIADYIEANL